MPRTAPIVKPMRGRPPLPAKTALARWIRDHDLSVRTFADRLSEAAVKAGLPQDAAPREKTLLSSVNARHRPSLVTMLLVQIVTQREVDLAQWVEDLCK